MGRCIKCWLRCWGLCNQIPQVAEAEFRDLRFADASAAASAGEPFKFALFVFGRYLSGYLTGRFPNVLAGIDFPALSRPSLSA